MIKIKLPYTLAVGAKNDLIAARKFADEYGMGFEIQHFYDPRILDSNWRECLAEVQKALHGFTGFISMHGAYESMEPCSNDSQIAAVTRGRYLHACQIADKLGARILVLHAWYVPTFKYHGGIPRWAERRIPFWGDMARTAEKYGLTIVLENTWEPTPEAQTSLLDGVNSPNLRACLDTGHANMTATTSLPEWIKQLGPRLAYVHAHNNSGATDDHWPFDRGTLNMKDVLSQLAALPAPPRVCLELRSLQDQVSSVKYLEA